MTAVLPFAAAEEAQIRREIRRACAEIVPADQLDVVVDLAVHGAQSALVTLERVCSAGSAKQFTAAIGPAVGILAGRCEMLADALKRYAIAQGMAHSERAIRFGEGAQ